MVILTKDTKNGFSFEGKLYQYDTKKSLARITLPFKKVRELNLKDKKLKITIELLSDGKKESS